MNPGSEATNPFEVAQRAAKQLAERTGAAEHDVAIVLGSGWAPAADALAEGRASVDVPLGELEGFAAPAVGSHRPLARSIATGKLRLLVYLGRVHLYEGYGVDVVVHPVRTAIAAGVNVVVLTNASGGIKDSWQPGQPVLISDHINLQAHSPLSGPSPESFGLPSRFVDVSDAYSPRLRALAREIDPTLDEGVYAGFLGPQYETPAEIRMARAMGADLVGMSTVMETIAARHLGAEVLALSIMTNKAAGLPGASLDHHDVVARANAAAARTGALLRELVERL